jgi:hypothetical protein
MNVLVRPKRNEARIARRRSAPGARNRQVAGANTVTTPHRRQELGPQQDKALYSCICGFVFEATVSTSVGCPHCGGTQAW